MKILFYNWVDYLDAEGRGGGVSLYQRNLIESLGEVADVDCYFLCSGISYDLLSDVPRWERVRHGPTKNADRRFEIVNSGCLSPGHHSFGHEAQLTHAPTEAVFLDFLEKHGPFDIVHFNNLEGLPARALALKHRFPDTRVIYTLHNYYPFCPQVNMWHLEKERCADVCDGGKCAGALTRRYDGDEVRRANAVAYRLKRGGIAPGSTTFNRVFGPAVKLYTAGIENLARVDAGARRVHEFGRAANLREGDEGLLKSVEPDRRRFRRRRETFVDLLNTECDRVLCVSARVAEIAEEMGVRRDVLQVEYIGSPEAERFSQTQPRVQPSRDDGGITLGYLGYMRRDKGFYFLLDALAALPSRVAERIHLVVCARKGDNATMKRFKELGGTLGSVRHADGYTHNNLDELLRDVDFGLIPVLWEDNLPQVAIEMHARHIPLITSNRGGARELGNTSSMVFEAGDISSFHALLTRLLSGEFDADAYWANARPPVSMPAHRDAILAVYRGVSDPEGDADSAAGADGQGARRGTDEETVVQMRQASGQ